MAMFLEFTLILYLPAGQYQFGRPFSNYSIKKKFSLKEVSNHHKSNIVTIN